MAIFTARKVDINGHTTAILSIQGEVDVNTEGRKSDVVVLHGEFDELINNRIKWIILDLSEATYIVSSGFGQILAAMTRLRARRGDLYIACIHGAVWTAASTVGLDSLLKFFSTIEEALAEIRQKVSAVSP